MTLSETVFSQVAPLGRLPTPKYSGDGRSYRDRTGTTNRIPSAEATSPPPQSAVISIRPWEVHQARRRRADALAVEVALLRPDQPMLGQRRYPRLHHRDQPDVAGPRHQQRGQADVQIIATGLRPGDVRDRVQEPGAAVQEIG